MNVNLKLLHTFLLVAEHCSFRRAAEESNRSQSAVSMQVRQLELQLGVSLFQRTTRTVQLTREGEILLESARKAVGELETGLRKIKDVVDLQRDHLSLACAPTIAATRLPAILNTFQKSFPNVTAHIRELASNEMLDAIREQDVDFGIGPRVPNAPEFHFHPIMVDEICALIPMHFGFADARSIAFAELAQLPLLVVTNSSAIQSVLDDAQNIAGVTLNIKYEVRQVQTQIAMAAAGLGAAIVPRIALPATADPRLVALPIVDPPLSREIGIVTMRGQLLSPVATRLVSMLQRLLVAPALDAESTAQDRTRRRDLALIVKNG
ncbi:LysR family transcriptional regulator [Sphingomonas sp. LaA6.9]|uniref:LysR family transcriptional regulator n=1 Tax=Sphingomonas sp. LaA6.9 TaxID=2919914 RepID=UPI001F4F7DCF|nr:LysR family transcriptional regulator [Sphingomonas sp. LaA6.9]MCJ8156111.1 LysR family transcriptional regulator [Sphingomonas sp. LaA6.9]